jgi:hypothetical protein
MNVTLRVEGDHDVRLFSSKPGKPLFPGAAEDPFKFALSVSGRKRAHNADELRAEIVGRRVCQTSST